MIFLTNLNKNFTACNYSQTGLKPSYSLDWVLVSLKKDYYILELDK